MSFVAQLNRIENNIACICGEKLAPQIIAVSKRQPEERIKEALEHGWRVFGENQVQEATMRWAERKKNLPDLTLHLIGPLQSNKVKSAVELFDVIHTVDREKIAVKLKKEMEEINRNLPCFVQVNIGQENSKSGIDPHRTKEFVDFCRNDVGLSLVGLMCIPPFDDMPEPYFKAMHSLNRDCSLTELSMGMSDDYEQAVRHGSTCVRIGSLLFGSR